MGVVDPSENGDKATDSVKCGGQKKNKKKKEIRRKKMAREMTFPSPLGSAGHPLHFKVKAKKKKISKNKTKKLGKTRYRLVLPDCLVFAVFLFTYLFVFFFKWELDSEIGSCKDSSTMQKKKKLGLIELKLMVCRRV